MIDTAKIRLLRQDARGVNLMDKAEEVFTGIRLDYPKDKPDEVLLIGYKENLKFIISRSSLKIVEGSLARFQKGSNLYSFKRSDLRRVFERLSDLWSASFFDAECTALHYGLTLPMNKPPQHYLERLLHNGSYKRLEQPTALYYSQRDKQLVFYDKFLEMTSRGLGVPDIYSFQHLLRYEIRYLRGLRKEFDQRKVTTKLVCSEWFYTELLKRYQKEYLFISKMTKEKPDLRFTEKSRTLESELASIGLVKAYGVAEAFKMVEQWYRENRLTRKQYYDHKKLLERLLSADKGESQEPLINELTAKIENQLKYYR